ncbi:glycosyltransferase family 2 protein [Pedobacter nanyangensis]|uniref:glycosyltransferase family 2 protein n=1 Tax=Pedobacter nanyangensis TaxID=1562389 RepID=UPI000DE4ACD4|nr:glycosyltransferase family 2 protein [Pedobacter nanyangensis]
MEPSVAVVILNWNGKSFLERFLPSVVQSNYGNLQIIVADNASTDDSISFIASNYPGVRVIVNDENYGFAEGYNRALTKVDADYFVLLNSDVEVPENWIKPVIELMQSDQKIAIAQPKIKWQQHKQAFEYAGAAGGFIDSYGFTFCRGRIFDRLEEDYGQYNSNLPIFWASGAAFFIKSKAWKEVGGLDPDLFAHMEEIDLCWRLKNIGYEVVCCTAAEVYHVGGGTLDAGSPFKSYLNFRNNLIIMQKNLPFGEATYKIFIRLWLDLAACIQFMLKGQFAFAFSINKAHFQFFKQIFRTSEKRSKLQLPLNQHQGVLNGSIVWRYFVKKIGKFSDISF